MAGLYIHIPFCKQACHYCNFHFSTSLKLKDQMVNAIIKEIELQKAYLDCNELSSIYLGGGTPSLLNQKEIERIFQQIERFYTIEEQAEITLEANPDDLTKDKLEMLAATPINRLSIGIQSFSDEDLTYMNRAHNAKEAGRCIQYAQDAGFDNLTVDLIYGTPTTSHAQWATNIQTVLDLDVPHISCYCLTVEPQTALDYFVRKKEYAAPDDEHSAKQFEYLMNTLEQAGYDHYEISNFAKPNHYAKHNSNYWLSQQYLGIGPSAHSFDGKSRQWNVANNAQYIKAIEASELPFEREELSLQERYNEYIMTSLRTIWGSDLNKIEALEPVFKTQFLHKIQPYLDNKTVEQNGNIYRLTKAGKLLADNIAMQLFF